MQATVLVIVAVMAMCVLVVKGDAQADCAQILASSSHMSNEEKQTLCKLYQSSTALTQLGAIVTDSLERFMITQSLAAEQPGDKHRFEKRKHEYLRFGRK